jgi:hypothetical protein
VVLVLERLGAGCMGPIGLMSRRSRVAPIRTTPSWSGCREWIELSLYFALKTSTSTSKPSPRYPQRNRGKTEEKVSHETQRDRLNV